MDGADLDPPAGYGRLEDDDIFMAEEVEEDQSVDEESVDEESVDDESVDEDQSASEESVDEKEVYPCLNPPAYGYPDDGERPPFILIEPYAYFADRRNATTASCHMRDLGGTLQVTFCVAQPPLVSYLCVHATAFGHTDFAVEPHIIATETNGGLVLLRVVIGTDPSFIMVQSQRQYFMYDASVPSLEHLPHPGYYHVFNDHSLAIVRKCKRGSQGTSRGGFILRPHGSSQEDHDCSNCDYIIAAQSRGFGYSERSQLILYHSDTKTWSNVPMVVKSYPSHRTCKTLTIGGDKGTVAWVDLQHNILLCDVLDKRPMLRTLDLPPPIVPRVYRNPRSVRDIAVLGRFFKYAELHYRRANQGLLGDSSPILYTWKVAVWSINTGSSSEDWHMDYLLNSTEIFESSLPKLRVDEGTTQPTLSTLHIGLPNLSLQDDDIVYFLTKINYRDNDHTAWVLAVDMRHKTIKKVGEFNSMRTAGLEKGYSASRISKYLKGASGAKQNTKRPGMPFLISSSKKQLGISMVSGKHNEIGCMGAEENYMT